MGNDGGPSGEGLPTPWRMTAAAQVQSDATAFGNSSYHAGLALPAAGFSPWEAVAAAASLGMARMRPLHYYLLGASSWFLAFGMQTVLFAWLVTMVLRESPEMVGVAQMTLLLPGTLLILAGGAFADRYGGRRMAVAGQSAAILAPLLLLLLVASGRLTFAGMLLYAAVIGCAQAFVTPARDALLNQVAGGRVQRTVMQVSAAQFGTQIVGILFASLADDLGAAPILGVQVAILAAGVLAFLGIDDRRPAPGDGGGAAAGLFLGSPRPPQGRSAGAQPASAGGRGLGGGALPQLILEGLTAVLRHRALRMVALQNVAMGLFLMGAYIVTLPVMVREVFQGTAADLSLMNSCNLVGLVLAILLLLRRGDVVRQGRALILAQWSGALVLILLALAPNYPVFLVVLFFWGASAGVAMSIARTIMQEQAPEALRGRVMAFSALSFIGAGPLGALLNGYLAEQFGAQAALGVAGAGMAAVMLAIGFRSPLWRLRTDAAP